MSCSVDRLILGIRIVAALALTFIGCGLAVAANPTLNVDLSRTEGPIRHAAAGLLWPFYQGSPPQSVVPALYDPLNIQFLRCSSSPTVIAEYAARDPLAKIIVGTSEPWGFPAFSHPNYTPPWIDAAKPDWTLYESKLKTQIANVKATGLTPVYEPWNEPNEDSFFINWFVDGNGNPKYDGDLGWPDEAKQFYFELYRRTYNLVRQLHPGAEITGPSDSQSEPGAMQGIRDFRDYCVDHHCVPDYWDWHFGVDNFNTDLNEVLGWNLNKGVLITEYLGSTQSSRPGRAAWEISIYERSRVLGAMKAQWSSTGQDRGTLNWLIFKDTDGQWKKHGIWWTYATYGAMTGDSVVCSTSNDSLSKVRGLIAYDKKKRSVVGLLGNSRYETDPYNPGVNSKINGYQGTVTVNVQSVLPLGRNVRLVVERIPSGITGFEADGTPIAQEVAAPLVVSDTRVSTLTNKISFNINWADGNDAYRFTITGP